MRIVQYKTILDEDRKNILVRESSKNYPDLGKLNNPDSVYLLANSVFDANRLAEEHVWLIAVNVKNHPIGVFEVSHGSDCASIITPRELFVRLFLCGAHAFFLIHNHPSGDTTPSSEDNALTKRVITSGKTLNVELLDHVIVADRMYYSYRESHGEWF
jgi:DNA repair protein RadC